MRVGAAFREKEEFRRGRNGERLVAELLQSRGWYVIPSYDYSGEDGDKPPRLQGAVDAFPLPDLDVARDGQRRWAEVKTKKRADYRSEEHTSELQSRENLVCRLLLEKKKHR